MSELRITVQPDSPNGLMLYGMSILVTKLKMQFFEKEMMKQNIMSAEMLHLFLEFMETSFRTVCTIGVPYNCLTGLDRS